MNTKKILEIIGLVILVLVVLQPSQSVKRITGQASSGLAATVATSSPSGINANAVTSLFATSTNCASRIISTTGSSAIMLTFNDYKGESPTAYLGSLQAASTTVAYDAGIYGCGAVKAFGFAASTVTLTELR